jgi:hypothetical protein
MANRGVLAMRRPKIIVGENKVIEMDGHDRLLWLKGCMMYK